MRIRTFFMLDASLPSVDILLLISGLSLLFIWLYILLLIYLIIKIQNIPK